MTGSTLTVLLRLAFTADDGHRMSWESVPTLMKRTGLSRRALFRSLSTLRALHIIEEPDECDVPPQARRYPSTVRRVTTPDHWLTARGVPLVTPAIATQNGHGMSINNGSRGATGDTGGVADDTRLQASTTNTSRGFPRRTSSFMKTTPRGVVTTHLGTEEDSDPAGDAEIDPSNIPDLQDEAKPQPPKEPPGPRRRRTKTTTPADQCVRLFRIMANRQDQRVPGATNDGALHGSIQRWLTEGFSYTKIVRMVEAYWEPTFQRSTLVPAWQDFLAHRGQLAQWVDQQTEAEDRRKRSRDKDWGWG